MKTAKNLFQLFLISLFLFNCKGNIKKEQDTKTTYDQNVIELHSLADLANKNIDSVAMLLPTIACATCIATGKNLIKYYNSRENWKFFILPNGKKKNSTIIYEDELSSYSNVFLDSMEIKAQFTTEDNGAIWVVFILILKSLK